MHDGFDRTARIAGLGAFLPEKVLTNHYQDRRDDTSDEWNTISTRIKERRVEADNQALVDIFERAGRAAMEDARVDHK